MTGELPDEQAGPNPEPPPRRQIERWTGRVDKDGREIFDHFDDGGHQ
jgi:hypothetical protein